MPRPKRILKPRFWRFKIVFGLICAALFAYAVYDYEQFETSAVHATGVVIGVHSESHATGRRGGRVMVDRPEVRFTVPGTQTELTATAKVLSRQEFKKGDQVPLEMDPRRPAETVRVGGGLSLLDWAFGVVGFALIAFGSAERWRYASALKVQAGAPAPDPAAPAAPAAKNAVGQPARDSV